MVATAQRRQEIVKSIRHSGYAFVEELSDLYKVSLVTIRNDLNLIESEFQEIQRCHGGAILKENFTNEITIKQKKVINRDIKKALAESALQLISDGEAIILDGGSTIEYLAKELKKRSNVVTLTNSINIAYELSKNPTGEVIILGGHLNKASGAISTSQPQTHIQNYRFNKLFLGADGLDLHFGVTTNIENEARVNREMCQVSNEIIVVADSSKLNKKSYCSICNINDIDILITDSGINSEFKKSVMSLGVKVIVV